MSSAHRPTWDPAQGRNDNRHVSKNVSALSLPAHTSLKYRSGGEVVPSTTDHGEETREALKSRLARAERHARNKKRKADGLDPEEESDTSVDDAGAGADADADVFKKPRLPSAPQNLEATERTVSHDQEGTSSGEESEDGDEDDEEDAEIEARAKAILKEQGFDDANGSASEGEESEDDDDDDDDDDETAQLMRELEKIKAERAAKKAEDEQREREKREEEIALGNPLLNGASESSQRAASPSAASIVSTEPSFGVKRRWDDDVIFKNQAAGDKKSNGDFVNDLTRTDFHKQFLNRYIK
ncbi:unnamed protein product [Parajaminaea phylloscopi]